MLNRRQMLGGLLALPLIPTFLKPNRKLKPCPPEPMRITAFVKDGSFISAKITSYTTTQIIAEIDLRNCAESITITSISALRGMLPRNKNCVELMPPNSSIVIRSGEILVITVDRYVRKKPTASFTLAKNRDVVDVWNEPHQLTYKNSLMSYTTVKDVISLRFDKFLDSTRPFSLSLRSPSSSFA